MKESKWSVSSKPLSEQETRKKMLALAKSRGCLVELKMIFDRYDRLLKEHADPQSRKQIAIMANVEVHKLLDFANALVVNGVEVIPADDNFKDPLEN